MLRRRREPAQPEKADRLQQYMHRGIGAVDGWLAHDVVFPLESLATAQREAGVGGGAAEIGVHHGQLFILLALLLGPAERALAVDLFENQSANVDGSGRGDRTVFEANLDAYGVDVDQVDILTCNSLDLDPSQVIESLGGPARLFSVDGGHTPELAANDLDIAARSVDPGGIIILDDAFSPMWPGVVQGMFAWYHRDPNGFVPFGLIGNKTLFTGSDHAERYRTVLATYRPHLHSREDELFGHPVTILRA